MPRKGLSQFFTRKVMNGRPEIASIEPKAAIAGGEIVIRGSGFAAGDHVRPQVSFGDLEAEVLISANNFLIARVPEGAVSSAVTVCTSETSNAYDVELGVAIAENLHPVANPAVDADGNIYVTFSGSRGQKVPVSLFKIDLNYQMKPFAGEIMNPTGLAFDREGYLYVSSRNDGTVYRAAHNGAAATYVEGMGIATGLAFDVNENLFVGDRSGTLFKISPDRQIFVFATLEPSIAAYHLAVGPDGHLYVSGPTTSSFDSVYRVSPDGHVDVYYRGLGRPQGLAFDAERNLYVAASLNGRKGIVRITPERRAELVISGTGLVGLAFAPGRSLVLATTNSVYSIAWPIPGWPLLP